MFHDSRFKLLIQEFFELFVQLFFPAWARRFDFSGLEWLDKELMSEPEGKRRELDIVGKVLAKEPIPGYPSNSENQWLALIHVEVESADKTTVLGPRFPEYRLKLKEKYRLPVLPIALFLKVGLEGIGTYEYSEMFWELEVNRFRYLFVGLPALSAEDYLNQENVIGIALSVLMKIEKERTPWLKAQALKRLIECGENDYRKFLLCECVQAYLPLEEPQMSEFNHLLTTPEYQDVLPTQTTWFEQGIEKGIEKGIEQGERRILLTQLEKRFGKLSQTARDRFSQLPANQLEQLGNQLLDAKSLRELGLED